MTDKGLTPLSVLRQYWGYDSFRPLQEDIINSVLSGHDTLALLPTGGGKSITFQVPALVLGGLTIVITPLISLMKDQVDNLRERSVTAVCIHSGLTRSEQTLVMDKCRLGKASLLYVSPEKLRSSTFIDRIRHFNVSLIAVDEAHCISQWGYDFRPSYLEIAALRDVFPDAPVLALTASATPTVSKDIMERLRFRDSKVFAKSFSRPNISYVVRYAEHKDAVMLKAVKSVPGTAIIYVRSRKRTREIAEFLNSEGISAGYYHAGLSVEEKNERQQQWKSGKLRVIVATNAFGMGIDKPDVRLVVHYDIPPSLEEYYQEAGRAGRDGLSSYALLIAGNYDKGVLTRRLTDAFPSREYIRRVYDLACNFGNLAVGEGYQSARDFDFSLFCTRFHLQPVMARSALGLLTSAGWIEYVEEVASRSRAMILLSKEELYSLRLSGDADKVLQLLLRTYTGLFADYVYISESLIASRLNIDAERVYQALLALGRAHALHYVPRSDSPYIYFPTSRELPKYVTIPLEVYEEQRDRMKMRIDAVKDFVFGSGGCRVNRMLEYFGETPQAPCGKCDVCRGDRKPANRSIEENILYLASQPGGHTIDYIAGELSVSVDSVIAAARPLLDSGALKLSGSTLSAE
ncbi:MAG: RecQ family ATP-dependent DNA helicase [Paramuribaculum sp.]|nr:RecQ family ATP-dependent DNA helicase [Paramuribaculum sp.]